MDNRNPGTVADPLEYGVLSGRDITGAFNGSMTLNDIFDLYAWLSMRGFTPDTLILHPLNLAALSSNTKVNNSRNCRKVVPMRRKVQLAMICRQAWPHVRILPGSGEPIGIADFDTLNYMYNSREISAANIGRVYGVSKQVVLHNLERHSIKRRGSTELKEKYKRVIHCDYCGMKIEDVNNRQPHRYEHSFCNGRCRSLWISKEFSGPDSWNWNGGCNRLDYGVTWKSQRKLALHRDGNICQSCDSTENLEVHHLIPFRMFGFDRGDNNRDEYANSLSNLMTLCRQCHGQLRGKESSETIMATSELIIDKDRTMEWSELHGNMESLAEMTRSLIVVD